MGFIECMDFPGAATSKGVLPDWLGASLQISTR